MGKVGTGNVEILREYTSGNWRVREWVSGLKECWFYGDVTFSGLAGGGLGELKIMGSDVPLPVTFTNIPCTFASCAWYYSE